MSVTKIYIKNNFTIVETVLGGDTDHIPTVDFDFEIGSSGDVDIFSRTRRGDYKRALWSDLQDESGAPIGLTLADVEDFLTKLSQSASSGDGGVVVPPVISTNTFPTGLNNSLPAGFRNVTITRLSGNVTVDLGNGVFELGGGSNPRGIVIEGDVYGNKVGILPAITITGGTWQWIATNLL